MSRTLKLTSSQSKNVSLGKYVSEKQKVNVIITIVIEHA